LGSVVLISQFGFTLWLSELIITKIKEMGDWRIQVVGWGMVAVALITALVFSKNIFKLFKNLKKQQEKDEEKLNRERLEANVRTSDVFVKSLRD
jgi:large-conductance mechanosensitive channel